MRETTIELPWRGKKFPCHYVTELDSALHIADLLLAHDGVMGFDIETTPLPSYAHRAKAALDPHYSQARLWQFFTGTSAVVFDLQKLPRSKKLTRRLLKIIDTKKLIAHNAIFELQFMYKYGAKTPNIICTLLMGKVLVHAGRSSEAGFSFGLEAMVKGFLSQDIAKNINHAHWGNKDLTFEQVQYAGLDAVATYDLAETLSIGMDKHNLWRYFQLIHKTLPVVALMQLNGSYFDMTAHRELVIEWREELYDVANAIKEMTGLKAITGPKMADWLDKKLSDREKLTWPRSEKTKKLKTDAASLSDHDYIPVVAPYSRYQKLRTLTTRYGNDLNKYVNEHTGRIHSQYKLQGARTGRFSSSKPNEQNAPKDARYRGNYKAPDGYVLCRADYSQIELRVMAELSQDKVMLDAFRTGKDLHDVTGAGVMGVSLDQFRSHKDYTYNRRFAKALNFLLVFGGGAETYANYSKQSYGVDKTIEEAFDEIKKWKELYAGVAAWQEKQAATAERSLITYTPMGKTRKLSRDNYYGGSMNTPVQGGAAECMMLSLLYIQEKINHNDNDAKIIKCVHDEIVVETHEEEIVPVSAAIKDGMTEAYLTVFPSGVTHGIVDVTYGHDWAEACED